nr:hypothetical protein [Lachnospiraceae bacterium]
YGYVEEEYLVRGYSNVYEYHDVGADPKIRVKDAPYCTRILVRRPADQRKQSDFAVLEIFNYSGAEKAFCGWGCCGESMLKNGDVWVGITIKQSAVECLKKFDPRRYKGMGFPNPVEKSKRRPGATTVGRCELKNPHDFENGLAYDALSQVAALLKSKSSENPLFHSELWGRPAKYVIGMGASGCDWSMYTAALQNHAFMDDECKMPCFDGFFIHMTGYPGYISNGETAFEASDDRCKIMTNVPLVWTQTMGDMRGGGVHPSYSYMYRWPDSDLPGRAHRQYEIAGAALGLIRDNAICPCDEDLVKAGLEPAKPLETDGDLEMKFDAVLRAVYYHLQRWIKYGIPAPASAYMEMTGEYPDADFTYDTYGNVKGGVRSPYVDVPVCTYSWKDEPGAVKSEILPFSKKQLKKLYPSGEDYVRKVIHSVADMTARGFILPDDGEALILAAMERAKKMTGDEE